MAYAGGKNGSGVYQTIINLMPPHETYIEAFLGAGAIMRLKRPALHNIGIDRDPEALKAYTALSDTSRSCTIKNDDALSFLSSYPFTGQELVYCDPPYLHETRSKQKLYRHEMSTGDHVRLLGILKALPCMVMISGYYSDLYADTLQDWQCKTFQAMTRAGKTATEWVWFNYPPPVSLHDYRYLGANYRERERIKRKKQRWVRRLKNMPMLERQALLCAMGEAWPQLNPSKPAVLASTAQNDDTGI